MSALFAYDFMRNAFAACALVALVSGVIGYFLVLRGEVFAGHALAHVAFPGATGAALVGISPLFGATALSILAGFGVSLLGTRANRDMAIGLVLTLSLGLGILFLHFYTAYAGMTTALLFGNVLGIPFETVLVLAGMSFVCLFVLAIIGRPLIFASLQPELAEAKGLPVGVLSAAFMAVTALAIAEAIQIVGVLLVFALLVAPGATASRLTRRVGSGVVVSVMIAEAIAAASLVFAFYTDWPTSFWISALGVGAYLASGLMPQARRMA